MKTDFIIPRVNSISYRYLGMLVRLSSCHKINQVPYIYSCFFMLPLNVYSATNECSSNYSLCLNQANGASAETLNCNRIETVAQDKRLNEGYRRYLANINSALRTATIKSQRAWITFRDAECDAEYAIEAPGSNAYRLYSGYDTRARQ